MSRLSIIMVFKMIADSEKAIQDNVNEWKSLVAHCNLVKVSPTIPMMDLPPFQHFLSLLSFSGEPFSLILTIWEGPIASCSRAIFRGGRNLHLLSRPILSAGAQQISWISFTSFAILFISGLCSIRIRKLMGRLFASYRVVAGVLNFIDHNNVSLPCSARAM